MTVRTIEETLDAWVKRHELRISDTYRDRFYYVDISDECGGRYEISIFKEDHADLVKVRVCSNRKRSCGFISVPLTDLEGVLEQAFSSVRKWVEQTGGRMMFPTDYDA